MASLRRALLVGTRKGLFILRRQGNADWKIDATAFLGEPVTLVYYDSRSEQLYAHLLTGHYGSKLHRSGDGGENWEECAGPVYPEGETVNEQPGSEKARPASLEEIWAFASGSDGRIWAGTIPGGLFSSDDGGDSWQLCESLWNRPERAKWFGGGKDRPGIHSIAVDPTDDNRLTIGVSCGGVWQTTDNGTSWNVSSSGMFAEYMPPEGREDPDIQDPHCLVQSPSQPDVMWVQHHNGIFRTTDRAATWQEVANVEPSSFGFPVCVHPHDAETAWFVPAQKDEYRIPVDAKMVVTRTRDGGQTFDQLRNGLPQEHAYDLVFRHAFDVDSTGDTLACGTTTGNLFTTGNAGDDWTLVTTHLPMVYAVRFVH